jgi:hypothetical protein
MAYFMNPSHRSVGLYVYPTYRCSVKYTPPLIARQRLGKHVPAAVNTRNSRRIVGHVCLWVCPCISISLLGYNPPVAFYPQEYSWYSFLIEVDSTPGTIVRLEGLGKLINPPHPGLEPATFQLVA